SKCTAGVPPARGRLAGREDEGGRDARGTLWATHLLTCTRAGAVAFRKGFLNSPETPLTVLPLR
ncbi:MAG: hypothetical protein ABSE73_24420, partial [Planctomycetota bacterium]